MMKKGFLCVILILYTALALLPVPASAVTVNALYRIVKFQAEFSPYPDTAPSGILPYGTNVMVASIEGDYAKFEYKGYNYYTKVSNLEKLMIEDYRCSGWAQEAVEAYIYGHPGMTDWFTNAANFRDPITRGEMAMLLVDDIMIRKRGSWQVQFTLKGVISDVRVDEIMGQEEDEDNAWFQISRLLYWGIVPAEKYRTNDYATYKEFTDALIKIVKYEGREYRKKEFTKATIDSFGVGGDTSPDAKITREQAIFLCQKTYNWMVEADTFYEAKWAIDNGRTKESVIGIIDGVYTLASVMGQNPRVAINAEGKAELSSAKAERFKFTYKGSRTNQFEEMMMLYTIQTMDGKYLALSGNVPTNGKQLITQDTEFLWAIEGPFNEGGQYKIYPPDYPNLLVSVEERQSKDGTPIIVGFDASVNPPSNYVFYVYYEGNASTSFSRWKELPATATPSKTSFVMNSQPVSVTAAYTINGTNYLQLRAIAAMLNGTAAQFDVGWDGKYAVIEPGKPYSGTVTETKLQTTTNVHISNTKFKLNDEVFTFSDARLIDGSTNYIQLREFAQKLSGTASQFNVYWDNEAKQAVIQPGVAYTGVAPDTNPSSDTITGSNKLEDGIYYIKASKNENFAIDIPGSSKENGAKLIIYSKTGNDNQKFKITNVSGNKYKIQCVHSGKWWNSSGSKGAVITQSDSASTFTITEQENGTYRIMDSKGFYAGISGANMKNGTNIILWTEASNASQAYIFKKVK
ncbi:RICIN domain-containing protein [Acetivibrio straminisolvens]|jgi:hypothetical protein|uniref:RICIN domain-containing protein n=1 Tax=Acetivibrio straminisolvens TaxID=253314 RepID=UPI00223F01E0|nr:RICIN domain-containing protein [Acetivibrio straminisolvens]